MQPASRQVPNLPPRNNLSIVCDLTTEEVVLCFISKMKSSNSTGQDVISSNHLKKVATLVSKILCHIYNTSIKQGTFPNKFQILIIRPIPKSGVRNKIEHYHPITLLSCHSKILEKIIAEHLTKYLLQQITLRPQQFGFGERLAKVDSILNFFFKNI